MNLKNKFKKFFTLRPGTEAGFTLVEMVVVVAILGILAGITVPAYTQYVEKAEGLQDQVILDAVNTAFAVACVDNCVDAADVEAATISVIGRAVHGLSTLSVREGVEADFEGIAASFDLFYTTENSGLLFTSMDVNSLVWNNSTKLFEMSGEATSARITLKDGTVVTISAEDMEAIRSSTYATMGYSGVKGLIDQVGESGEMLAGICAVGTFPNLWGGGYTGLMPKITNALKAFGIIDSTKESEMLDVLNLASGATDEEKDQTTKEVANGLAMVTAKYLAGGGNADELLAVDLGNSAAGVIEPMATGTGGTKTVSAIAVQYAMASGFANSSVSEGVTIDGKTVAEYMASAEDPIEAINTVKNLEAYQKNYVGTEQYESDKNGFVGTMSILGDNIGTTTNPGNIDINDYLSNGLESEDAKDILTGVLGE